MNWWPRLIIYDFDGVMTDNRVLVFANGEEAVFVNRSDGLAIKAIKEMGIEQIIISTETNPVVKARAKKLGISVIHSVENKRKVLESYLEENNVDRQYVMFVGNDINDKEVMEFVGFSVAPSDAHKEIKAIAKTVLNIKGGFGVVREILDRLKEGINER